MSLDLNVPGLLVQWGQTGRHTLLPACPAHPEQPGGAAGSLSGGGFR